ncbi:MAG: signal peptidase II [bacterium]|nr:signal peptidase II [bacterium]
MKSRKPRSAKADWLLFAGVAMAMLILDILTKQLVLGGIVRGEYLGGLLRITLVHNPGAAFGLFSGARVVFIVIKSLALVLILFLMARQRHLITRSVIASMALIFSGALGNLLDRLRGTGEVVDFIDVGIGLHRWYVFNVADACICVGAFLIALGLLIGSRRDTVEA